jgi:hypothetical protein
VQSTVKDIETAKKAKRKKKLTGLKEKKTYRKKKTNEEKEKKSKLIVLIRQT